MNISSLASVNATSALGVHAGAQQDFRTRMQQSMAPVAKLFGMTTDQLMSAVKSSGMSLADYAASKGITNDNLTAAVKQGLRSGNRTPSPASGVSDRPSPPCSACASHAKRTRRRGTAGT